MAEMKQNLHCGRHGLLKHAPTLDTASSNNYPAVPETAIQAFP